MIRVLAPDVIDRIAAGEVVERPASVVKELVENALDAGASEIAVEFAGGGVERMEVADDGAGMEAGEASLALERHATSKIAHERDLESVGTYGFRGEALPSIAAVSKMTLLTRSRGAQAGTRIIVHGGEVVEAVPAGVPPGTRVRVEDLFHNTPARLKFLKTRRTETSRVMEVVRHMALVHPHVAFSIYREGVEVLSCPHGQQEKERIQSIFAKLTLYPISHAVGAVRVHGMLGAPSESRKGTSGLVIVVNRRVVVERSVAGALAAGHEGLLPAGRYPQGVIFIEMPGQQVDVNVHPQKSQVRFAEPRDVTGAVYRAASAWARTTPWKTGQPMSLDLSRASGVSETSGTVAAQVARPTADQSGVPRVSAEQRLPGLHGQPGSPGRTEEPDGVEDAPVHGTDPSRKGRFSSLVVVGQAMGTYILCEHPEGLVVVDQHAAAERITFEKLKNQYARGLVQRQLLLVPARCDLDERWLDLVEQNEGLLRSFGMQVDITGPTTVTVREIPVLLGEVDPALLLREILDELQDPAGRIESVSEHVLATMACHASVRGGDVLDTARARALLQELDRVDWSTHCPHGRPVFFEIPGSEIQRRLGR